MLSAAFPGAGQYVLGQDRFAVYAAAEIVLLLKGISDVREQRRQEGDFRSLARQVARSHFSANLPDGPWDYYESMEECFESGAFSLSETDLLPETDATTFNGSRWLLAARNHGVDPVTPDRSGQAYHEAIAEYVDRAAHPDFLWSWRNAQLEWDLYHRVINKRNDAARAVGVDMTLLLANHVLSVVDAFANYRVRVGVVGGSRPYRVTVTVPLSR